MRKPKPIPPDDLLDAYLDADDTKKAAIADLLRPDVKDFICATFDSKDRVMTSMVCNAAPGMGMIFFVMKGLTDSFGKEWREHVITRLWQ